MLYIIHYDYSVTNEMMNSLSNSYKNIKTIKLNLLNKKLTILQRLLLKLSQITKTPFVYKYLYTKKEFQHFNNITKDDRILFWDYIVDYNEFMHLISLTNVPHTSISLWVWNTIDNYSAKIISKIKQHNIAIYTFDKIDSQKYNIKLLNQVHYRKPIVDDNNYIYDFLFLGTDKGRCETLNNLSKILKSKNYNCKFIIVIDKNKDYSKYQDLEFIESNLSYNHLLDLISKTKVLVDITKSTQIGITLRVVESIFYNKKLLTNNKSINELDIYSENNMLIMDDKNNYLDEIDSFYMKPIIPYNKILVDKYCIENWIKQFI